MDDRPLILGAAAVPFTSYEDGSTWRDWVFRVAADAIADAGLEPSQIDDVIVASETDFLTLQLVVAPLLVDDLGLVPKPVARVESGGASGANALRLAMAQVIAGVARSVLVIGFEQAASHLSGDDVRMLYGLSFDADIDGMAGATAVNLYALSISEHMACFGTSEAQLASISVKNHGNAMHNPWAHKPLALRVDDVLDSPLVSSPYKVLDCSMISDGAAAVVLCHPRHAPRNARPRVRISGSGCASDFVRLGDRPEVHRFAGKAAAARAAYRMAGIRAPTDEIDAAEVYDAFTGAEIQAIEALGLCPEGQGGAAAADGAFGRDGPLPVNLSGGLIGQGGAPGAVGVMQAVTMSRLITGRYWPELQPDTDVRRGLVDAHAGVGTLCVTHILERLD